MRRNKGIVEPPALARFRGIIEENLERFLPKKTLVPQSIHEAMHYSVCGGGKRIRGSLCLLSCQTVGGDWEEAIPAACALEMVHAYSLIHDDLPCMDNDDLRRGKPTNHRVFGEAIALLAGDALLTQAFGIMLKNHPLGVAERYYLATQELASAIDTTGMIGGQVLDLEGEGQALALDELQAIHKRKTGALIKASLRMGAIIGEASAEAVASLTEYGEGIGLAFQIIDDLLDSQADPVVLGKNVGSDEKKGKATYATILGPLEAKRLAEVEINKAKEALKPFGEEASTLIQLADFVLEREY
jgi:geranylgeranyl diphosphate synthase type II